MSEEFRFTGSLEELDPAVYEIIQRESKRQDETIVLIASESESPSAIHEAIASPFAHVYAEGYPREASRRQTEAEILDMDAEVAYYRRNSDPRYYKGVEYADIVEALTRRRAAELFAANGISPDDMYINVQPLSGGPANSAVYTALIQPGDTVMGLKLSDGGHLSHGATVNRSGQVYKSVSYIVDPELEAINYDDLEAMVLKHQPNVLVCGYSAYPLIIDWQRIREIADKVGAYMLADIAHISGLVASGVHPSPIGIADVVSTTTHKSLCGPRGAMIMTHKKELASKIDKAVFPGEQGGPHLNTMVALATALKLAQTDKFRSIQEQIVKNAARLAEKLTEHGFKIPFGRSENHLLLVDCRSVRVDGVPLTGDIAARILDVAGIVVNRNNIPGDKSAINPWGLRLGLVWPTQLGFKEPEIDKLAEAIATILKGCTPFYYRGSKGKIFRAKVDPAALARGRELVRELRGLKPTVYPSAQKAVVVRGEKARRFLDAVVVGNVIGLAVGEAVKTDLYGHGIDCGVVIERQDDAFVLHFADADKAGKARLWLADLSDGYVDFGDLHGRLPGPIVATQVEAEMPTEIKEQSSSEKPFFVGAEDHEGAMPLPAFRWSAPEIEVKRTALYDRHVELSGKMVPFGGYDMPVWYSSVGEEHEAVRTAAGLFDVSHMGVFEVRGEGAVAFLNMVTTNDVSTLKLHDSHYTYLPDANGRVIDDLLIYRTHEDAFMLVVNAANNDEDWAWLNAVNDGNVRVSEARPSAKTQQRVILRDLRDEKCGNDRRVDIALQGPSSTNILALMADDQSFVTALTELKWGNLAHGSLAGHAVTVSRTGYTGERVGYEIFVHPDQLVSLWNAILEQGEPYGVAPCGLASRDSTRTEAGLPLHGHELAGPLSINPFEAGFSRFVKLSKPFFVGRNAMINASLNLERTVVRFRMDDKGVRRPELGDPILDKRGKIVGKVTSCAIDREGYLLGLALVPMDLRRKGTSLSIYQTGGGSRPIKVAESIDIGEKLPMPDTATVISRFP